MGVSFATAPAWKRAHVSSEYSLTLLGRQGADRFAFAAGATMVNALFRRGGSKDEAKGSRKNEREPGERK
jgi:hypothetical protein